MFERYTERARRVIFFSRYEASTFGSDYIEPEHLLLAILREDKAVRDLLGDGGAENIRKRIEAYSGPPKSQISTAVDMPLSHPSKRILAYGAEEAELLGHQFIGVVHLALGVLRENESFAARLLRKAEIDRKKLEACHNAGPQPNRIHQRMPTGSITLSDTQQSPNSAADRATQVAREPSPPRRDHGHFQERPRRIPWRTSSPDSAKLGLKHWKANVIGCANQLFCPALQ